MWTRATVHERASHCPTFAGCDFDQLRGEVGWCSRACSYDLPQVEVLVRYGCTARSLVVVLAGGIVVQRPRAAGIEPFGHDHQPGAQRLIAECDTLADLRLER